MLWLSIEINGDEIKIKNVLTIPFWSLAEILTNLRFYRLRKINQNFSRCLDYEGFMY